MDLLETPPAFNLYDSSWRIYGRNPVLPPHYIAAGAEVSGSMVTEGCLVAGKVEHSILFSGAQVEEGAVVRNCVLFKEDIVRRNAQLSYIIADKDVEVLADRTLMGHATYPIVLAKGSIV